ncbi:MAG: hypothetical protein MI802_24005, partial [Desulfobacterales bacterium]|nr:hypothetical protein [Desulfobacterales bacterium]
MAHLKINPARTLSSRISGSNPFVLVLCLLITLGGSAWYYYGEGQPSKDVQKPEQPGLIKQVAEKIEDIINPLWDIKTGAHPVKPFPNMLYFSESTDGKIAYLTTPSLIMWRDYSPDLCEGEEVEDCKNPLSDQEHDELIEYCRKQYGDTARLPKNTEEVEAILKAQLFFNHDNFAIWTMQPDPEEDDNFRVVPQKSGIEKTFIDDGDNEENLSSTCVLEVDKEKAEK